MPEEENSGAFYSRDTDNVLFFHLLTKGGNPSNMYKHLNTQHAINLHVSNVFDTLLSDGGANENPIRIDKRINKELNC